MTTPPTSGTGSTPTPATTPGSTPDDHTIATTSDDHTIAWFHCFAGIAGDMALGSLIDAGADLGEVLALVRRVPLSGWDLRVEETLRGGVACRRAIVTTQDDVVVRTHAHIIGLLAEAALPERVHRRSMAVFAALAEVEGRLHRRNPEQVHFHEVGGHDAVVDIVGTAAALEVLGIDDITASAVATGTGVIRTADGLLPNPSPAVVGLLRGAPTYGRETTVELTTPTGAAILSALATSFGPMPAMTVTSDGFGAGANELDDLPNCTQVVVGSARTRTRDREPDPGQPVFVLEANLDDATGEQLALAVSSLLDAGALDAWISPVLMKKGRPGHVIHTLADPAHVDRLRRLLRTATGSFGVRALSAARWPSARSMHEVEVAGALVRMKVGPDRAKAEFEDVARVSLETGLPPHQVTSLAEEAWRRRVVESPRDGDQDSSSGSSADSCGPARGPGPSDDEPA